MKIEIETEMTFTEECNGESIGGKEMETESCEPKVSWSKSFFAEIRVISDF